MEILIAILVWIVKAIVCTFLATIAVALGIGVGVYIAIYLWEETMDDADANSVATIVKQIKDAYDNLYHNSKPESTDDHLYVIDIDEE